MENQQEQTGPSPMWQVVNWENAKGHRIVERVPRVAPPPGYVHFVGYANITVHTPRGPADQPFTFPIEADTIERAFEMFEATAQAAGKQHIQEIQNEIRRAQLMRPVSASEAALLDVSGNPIKR